VKNGWELSGLHRFEAPRASEHGAVPTAGVSAIARVSANNEARKTHRGGEESSGQRKVKVRWLKSVET
jgi:hypothetical protein